MAKMAKTIDGFTQHQTRLAVVIDGLDSCEQDKVLQMLDTVSPHTCRSMCTKGRAEPRAGPRGASLTQGYPALRSS